MESNYKFIDLGDKNLSRRLAHFLDNDVDWSKYTPERAKDSIYAITNWLPKEAVASCRALMAAVDRVCNWNQVSHVMIFRVSPGIEVIHRDQEIAQVWPNIEVPVKWALNIPVTNCDDTYTAIYEALPGQQYALKPNIPGLWWESGDDNCHVYRPDQVREIDRYSFVQPVVLNTHTIHCIHNPTNQVSVRLSLRMNCNVLEKYVNL
jgi:hypothetical protein